MRAKKQPPKTSRGKKPRGLRLPGARWPEGSTRRLLLALLTSGCLFLAAWARIIPQKLDCVEGDVVERTIRAPRSGYYVDPDEMTRLREQAAASVPEVYDAIPDATNKALTALDDIMERFNEVRADASFSDPLSRVRELRSSLDIRLSNETLELAAKDTTTETALARVHEGVANLVRREMAKEIRGTASGSDDLRKARETVAEAARGLGLTSAFTAMSAEIAQAVIRPNRILNTEATQTAQQQKRDAVNDVSHPIQAGDILVLAGEEVRPRHIAAFQAVGLMQARIDYSRAIGVLVTATVMVLLLGVFTMWFAPDAYASFQQLATLAALLVVVAFIYRTIGPTWFDPGAVSTALIASMIVALVISVHVAMATGVCSALLLAIVASGTDARLILITTFCTVIGVFAVSRSGNKSTVIARAAPLMAFASAGLTLVGGEMFGIAISTRLIGLAAAGGLASPLLAMGASIALERVLGVTTDFRLMELGNPNEPILQRLIREAPGSYQSSVMVGNLAEPAAEAIGANALLVRTAAMYHDIGKIRRPYFFVENQFGGDNPHDRLSPNLSALVIINHVKDGLELADEYGLPPAIKSFIAEHHGTSLVKYFHQRALEQADSPQDVREANFRYPGPRPQSRETALLMLADVVEAAARTLDNPTHQETQDLVNRLIDGRIEDFQLDESPLSFKDLATVKRVFVATLTSMFHQRIKYPEQIIREAANGDADRSPQEPRDTNGDRSSPANGSKPSVTSEAKS